MAVGTPRIVLVVRARRRTGCFLAQCTPPSPAGNRALLHASARRTPAPSSPLSAHGPSDVRSCKDARTRSCAGGPRAADAHRGTSSRGPVSQTRLLALSLPAPLARYCSRADCVALQSVHQASATAYSSYRLEHAVAVLFASISKDSSNDTVELYTRPCTVPISSARVSTCAAGPRIGLLLAHTPDHDVFAAARHAAGCAAAVVFCA